jgi:hypothetical protein
VIRRVGFDADLLIRVGQVHLGRDLVAVGVDLVRMPIAMEDQRD